METRSGSCVLRILTGLKPIHQAEQTSPHYLHPLSLLCTSGACVGQRYNSVWLHKWPRRGMKSATEGERGEGGLKNIARESLIKCRKVRVILRVLGIRTPRSFHYSCLCISPHLLPPAASLPLLTFRLWAGCRWGDDKLRPLRNLPLVLSLFNNRCRRNHSGLAAIVLLLALCDYSP